MCNPLFINRYMRPEGPWQLLHNLSLSQIEMIDPSRAPLSPPHKPPDEGKDRSNKRKISLSPHPQKGETKEITHLAGPARPLPPDPRPVRIHVLRRSPTCADAPYPGTSKVSQHCMQRGVLHSLCSSARHTLWGRFGTEKREPNDVTPRSFAGVSDRERKSLKIHTAASMAIRTTCSRIKNSHFLYLSILPES